jgi:hypothetical protein
MNVEIGAEAALFPEKAYINGMAVAVWKVGPLDNESLTDVSRSWTAYRR